MDMQKKAKIIYYYDALCGWCFGFSPAISKLHEKYKDSIDFEVISGGLFLNERAGRVNEVAPHIKNGAYKFVEERTGVKFGGPFINDVFGDGVNTLDSLWPAIALCIVKEKFPKQAMTFAKILTHAIYEDGVDSIDLDAYSKYATQVGFDADEFDTKIRDEKYKALAQQEFYTYANSGIRGFPTVLVETEKGKVILAQGQSNYAEMDQQLARLLG